MSEAKPTAAKTAGPLRVVPLGGLSEIGMNCMSIEYGDDIIIVDCGIMFSELENFGVEFMIPDFTYLLQRKDKIRAIIATHGHEDHIGAIPFLLKAGIRVPIFASTFTSLLMREKFREYGLDSAAEVRTFKMGQTLQAGAFKFRPVSVNHSIVDAAALLIETPAGKIIHTGDFKIDPTPFYGSQLDLREFGKAGEEGVLLLMSDSTNVERTEHSMSESGIYQKFEELCAMAEGLTVISMFSSNVSRMGQAFKLAKKMGKKVILAGRSMEQNVRLGMEAGYLEGADSLIISADSIDRYPRDKIIVLSTGSQGEHRSSLIRMAHGEHPNIELGQGDLVLMSSKFIPGNEVAIGRMINQLFKQGAEVLYEAVHDIHTSGHATRPELKQMLEAVKPRFFIPVHGEYRHLVHHARLAEECGVDPDNVLIAVDGDVVELSPEGEGHIGIVEKLDNTRILVESREGSDISRTVLKERRQLAEKGVVFTLIVRNADTGKIISGPEILSKGLVREDQEGWLIEEAKKVVTRVCTEFESSNRSGKLNSDLQEAIRIELRRYFNNNLGKKPTVLPIVLEL